MSTGFFHTVELQRINLDSGKISMYYYAKDIGLVK